MSGKLNIFVKFNPLTKSDEEQCLVSGYASTEAMDSQGEIITLDALKEALPDYMKYANIREMHQAMAAGKAVTATIDDKGLYVCAKVVDKAAWTKVKEQVYQGFSVGGRTMAKDGVKITRLKLSEISLVDRPANPEATFDTWKADTEVPAILPTANLPKHIQDLIAKVQSEGKLAKGMQTITSLAWAIDTLQSAQANAKWEADAEGDGSTIPTRIQGLIEQLGQVLVDMTAEEVSELTVKAATGGPIQGGSMNAADRSKLLKNLADALKVVSTAASKIEAPAAEEMETLKADMELVGAASKELAAALAPLSPTAPVAKAEVVTDHGETLAKTIAGMLAPVTETLENIGKRLKAVEDTPNPARSLGAGAGVVVNKAEDMVQGTETKKQAAPKTAAEAIALAKMDPIPLKIFDNTTNEDLAKRLKR